MRVAAIYDIHGNVPALEAVLQQVHEAKVDRIVVGGDIVPGPMPRETILHLQDLHIPVSYLYGNGEVAVLDQMRGKQPSGVPRQYLPVIEWTAEQVADCERFFRDWPMTISLEIPGLGRVLFCHATPRNENEIFTRVTEEERLLPLFRDLDAEVVVCGHTHMQFDRMIGLTRVVNAGSVGMPFGNAGADWVLLGPDVQFQHTSYDLAQAAERIRASGYPDAENFVAHHVLQPPTEEQMLNAFARTATNF